MTELTTAELMVWARPSGPARRRVRRAADRGAGPLLYLIAVAAGTGVTAGLVIALKGVRARAGKSTARPDAREATVPAPV